MAGKKSFSNKQRVALAEDISYRGYIYQVNNGYSAGDPTMYNVQWDKNGMFLYLGEALITEKEADEIQEALAASANEKKAIEDKFKSMEKK